MDWVADRRIVLLLTPALLLQYEHVLKRPEQLRASGLTPARVDRILAALASAAEPVTIHYSWRPQLPDPGDDWCSKPRSTAQRTADALVTYNLRHFVVAVARFGLRVARPVEVLEEIKR